MKDVKGKSYLLSDNEIERCLKLYGDHERGHFPFLSFTTSQRKQVLKIEAMTKQRHDINEQILSLVRQYQD